ncbi:unnamed protein product [Diabrotica balteata]|uniref:Uncharacterized protein n=1 Tax=Diabrotica balteata TaxID=107213 RepID=A0A9N9STW4_DIABA|nr:unnamed protein product [Diabrotica balteata]
MDIPFTSDKSNNTFNDSEVSSIDETYADSGFSYNPSDMEDSSGEKSNGENENALVTGKNLQSSFQSNNIANPGEILRSMKRGARRKFADKSQWQRNIRKQLRNSGHITKRYTSTFIGKLPLLYPEDKDIQTAKFSNLQDLLVYVPPYLHNFYNNLNVKNFDQRVQNNDDGEDNVFYAIEDSEQMME